MLCENSREIKEMFDKRTKKLHQHKNDNPETKQLSSSPLNKDIEIYESSSQSSQDIKWTSLKNSDIKIWINDKDISNAVTLNFIRKQQDTANETDYANDIDQTTIKDVNAESSKDISSFGFDFSNLDISITKDEKVTPSRKFPPIRIPELWFPSSSDKYSSSTEMHKNKLPYKYLSERKGNLILISIFYLNCYSFLIKTNSLF